MACGKYVYLRIPHSKIFYKPSKGRSSCVPGRIVDEKYNNNNVLYFNQSKYKSQFVMSWSWHVLNVEHFSFRTIKCSAATIDDLILIITVYCPHILRTNDCSVWVWVRRWETPGGNRIKSLLITMSSRQVISISSIC